MILSAGAFSDPKVVEASGQLTPIFVDCDWGKKNADISGRYRVRGYPTVIFTSPEGREIGRLEDRDAASVARQIEGVAKNFKPAPPPGPGGLPVSPPPPEPLRTVGMVSRSIKKTIDPWEHQEPGGWYRMKVTAQEKERYIDLGLKSRGEAQSTLLSQEWTGERLEPVKEIPSKPANIKVIGEETLQVQSRSFRCEVRCSLDEVGNVKTDDREWVIKDGRYAGARLKKESPKLTVVAGKVWDHTLKVKGREFDCLVVEVQWKSGDQTREVKTWHCSDLPNPLRIETDETSTIIVDFGSDWSKRPPFPGGGSSPPK
jgi:hypothetical protein